ncbi:MAG: metal ABC transporter ATP-binding protein [Archaeoglobales archaeon]|nr:MAG: metal ABC transporter ATP-binding protein [Archaeoglobales archaeon]
MRVKLRNVYVAYSGSRKPTIKDITLTLDRGVYVITGPNGAGKTTLLETIIGLLKPYRGEAYLLGVNTKSRRIFRARRKCSYVPQDFMKPPTEAYTGMDVIRLGLVFNRGSLNDAIELAKRLNALDLLEKPFGKLSGGQQQKIMILRALARNPEILLLDEPFSSLDAETKENLCEILKEYSDRLVVIVCHDTSIVKRSADHIVRMEEGRVVDIS